MDIGKGSNNHIARLVKGVCSQNMNTALKRMVIPYFISFFHTYRYVLSTLEIPVTGGKPYRIPYKDSSLQVRLHSLPETFTVS